MFDCSASNNSDLGVLMICLPRSHKALETGESKSESWISKKFAVLHSCWVSQIRVLSFNIASPRLRQHKKSIEVGVFVLRGAMVPWERKTDHGTLVGSAAWLVACSL